MHLRLFLLCDIFYRCLLFLVDVPCCSKLPFIVYVLHRSIYYWKWAFQVSKSYCWSFCFNSIIFCFCVFILEALLLVRLCLFILYWVHLSLYIYVCISIERERTLLLLYIERVNITTNLTKEKRIYVCVCTHVCIYMLESSHLNNVMWPVWKSDPFLLRVYFCSCCLVSFLNVFCNVRIVCHMWPLMSLLTLKNGRHGFLQMPWTAILSICQGALLHCGMCFIRQLSTPLLPSLSTCAKA